MTNKKYEDDDIALWGNVEPICPHCGHEQEMTDLNGEFECFEDEEIIKTYCDSCEEGFHIQLNMPITYKTFVAMD